MALSAEDEKLLKLFQKKEPQAGYGVLAPETVKDDSGKEWEVDRANKQVIQRDDVGTTVKKVGKDPVTQMVPINDGLDPREKATQKVEAAPVQEAPEAPKPTGTRKYASPEVAQTTSTKEKMVLPNYAPDTPVWERALIGATPLLVGLLTGNQLEGAQVASQHVVTDEGDRYKRGKDFNQKLAEMAAKREFASTTGKLNAKTFEYRGSDDVNRIGRFVNGQQLIDEANDPLSPVDAKKDNIANFDYEDEHGRPRIGTRINGKMVTSPKDPVKFVKPTYGYKEVLEPGSKKNVLVSVKDGELHKYVADIEAGKKGGLSLEDRMKLSKYNKDLKKEDVMFEQERKLNNDREQRKTTKDTRDIAAAHSKIMDASFGKNPVSDIASVINLFKLLDPGSVVRESELALGLGARSVEDFVDNAPTLIMKQGGLTPVQKRNIRALADKIYNQQLKLQESSVDGSMKERAGRYGLKAGAVAPPIKSPYKAPSHVTILKDGKPYSIKKEHLDKILQDDPNVRLVE